MVDSWGALLNPLSQPIETLGVDEVRAERERLFAAVHGSSRKIHEECTYQIPNLPTIPISGFTLHFFDF